MAAKPLRSARLALALAGSIAGGCLLVAPLDELPTSSTGGAGGGSGKGGTSSGGSGGSLNDGGAGAGDMPSAGRGGAAGKGASGGKGGGLGGSGGDGGAGDGGAPGGKGGCTTNADCVKPGASEPYRCRTEDGECIPLKSNECPLVYGPDKDPNAIYFGSFAYLNPERLADSSIVWAERLALDELNAVDGGLPGGPEGAARPLVMIVCNSDTSEDATTIESAMEHLADEVGVSALLATLKPDDLRNAFEQQLENELFFLSPISLTNVLTDADYPDHGLIWNLLGEPLDFAPAYARLLSDLEAYLRAERGLPDVEANPFKVALVGDKDPFAAGLQTFVFSRLEFNGKDAAGNRDDGNFLSVTIDPAKPDLLSTADQIITFAPDIIVSTGTDTITQGGGIAQLVEENWLDSGKAQRPYFILSPYNAGDLAVVRDLIQVFKKNYDDLTDRRYLGLSAAAAANQSLQNDYAARLYAHFPDAIADTGNYYDATYTLAYALALTERPVSGPKIAAAMPQLVSGTAYDVGPDDIGAVYKALSEKDASIELVGTLGPLDFDLASGVRRATPSVFCFTDEKGVPPIEHIDALRYDTESDSFEGTYPCMPAFPPPPPPP